MDLLEPILRLLDVFFATNDTVVAPVALGLLTGLTHLSFSNLKPSGWPDFFG